MSLTLKLITLLLLALSHHAESGSIVKFLPGFEGPLPFELETGYIGVGDKEDLQMFYYFVKSENNPQEDPLLIWLTGGPGCSSLFAILFENGPLALKFELYNGTLPSLVTTTYSWTKMANIVFLDQPVGAGFSYSRTPLLNKVSDTGEVKVIHEFLQKWLSKHPEFYSNPFYVTGDSYSGKIVPPLVQEISRGNYICCKPPINIQGYILGNPITQITSENNSKIPYAHGMALISDELYESLKRICKGNYENVGSRNTECLKHIEIYNKCTDKLNTYHILLPDCDMTSPDCFLYNYFLLNKWANNERVRRALQVTKGSIGEWRRCNYDVIPYNYDIQSTVPYHMNNSISGFRSLIYSGDHDMLVPFIATQAWIRSLNYSIVDDWRPWMVNDQIAGYTRSYANKMTYATIKASFLVDTRQNINQTKHSSCSKGGSVASLCNRG
ncbi:serine carboxypeptidase-like 13 isoform X2 [Brassica napus]|uniref:serine carboxypeptidase-like 13 isoform X2 n=1 Tax=Brassica oleracea var. oleracea TaxID=109376 RepID=UPI0006A713DD|nr:PREDICTED: serine carboxypeptidase-like 13 isoform X2 [Brassica oleracea var. oleracea]XP_013688365.2 serine carboxypeptidase-like 13 isoform X2 [Brassica napus]